jgi:hypothetical protein
MCVLVMALLELVVIIPVVDAFEAIRFVMCTSNVLTILVAMIYEYEDICGLDIGMNDFLIVHARETLDDVGTYIA